MHSAVRPGAPLESLRAGDLMDEVHVDEEQVGLARRTVHDMTVPELLGQCLAHDHLEVAISDFETLVSLMGQPSSGHTGVVDKSVAILGAVATDAAHAGRTRRGTGLPRATAHRLAVALEVHRLVARDAEGRFVLGPRVGELAARTARRARLRSRSRCWPGCATSAARAHSSTGATVPSGCAWRRPSGRPGCARPCRSGPGCR